MAQLAVFIPYIVAAAGTLLQGGAAKNAAGSTAAQLERDAGQERAASQRTAGERRRSARYLQSRALALAAASGAGASDPSVVNTIAGIEGEGEYGALAAMFEGEDRARSMEYGATLARKQGQAAQSAAALKAGATILSGADSWYSKYGGGGSPGSAFTREGAVRQSVLDGTAMADYGRRPVDSPRYA